MNPFNPNFGNVPKIFIDRSEQIKQVLHGLDNFGSPYQTTLVYGLRGVGKTSFVSDISQQVAKRKDWMVVNLALGDDLISSFVQLVYNQANNELKKILDESQINFSHFGFSISYHNDRPVWAISPRVAIETLLQKLQQKKLKLLVTIDEVQSTPEVRKFASIYQLMRAKEYRIALLMTGLPDKVSELQNEDVLTFLLRSGRIVLEPLDMIRMQFSYQKAFASGKRKVSSQILKQMVQMTHGYAYAFQLLGYLVWETKAAEIDQAVLAKVLPTYQEMLDRNVYVKIYESLSQVDRKFVRAMAAYQKAKVPVSFIGQQLGKSKNYVSNYRRRLLDDQVIEGKEWGLVSFTLPYFKEFVRSFGDNY